MRRRGRHERGAALVMVLVFMVITLILITATLVVSGNEIQIAALHRDGVRALDLANAGIQEAIARILSQHPTIHLGPMSGMDPCRAATGGGQPQGFTSSLDSTNLKIGVCGVGTGSQFLEVYADATVNKAVRKLGRIVQITARNVPPEIVLAGFVGGGGSQNTEEGDTYSPKSAVYKTNPDGYIFSGWRIGKSNSPDLAEKNPNDPSVWCYGRQPAPGDENAHCAQDDPDNNWFPGTRLMISESDTYSATDVATIKNNNSETAPACPSTALAPPADAVTADDKRPFTAQQLPGGTPGFVNLYGFDKDIAIVGVDQVPQAMTNKHPCGLPYVYIPQTFTINCDSGVIGCSGGEISITRYFKTVIFEQWFETYYKFSGQSLVERDGSGCSDVCLNTVGYTTLEPDIKTNPQFAAIPPFPSTAFLTNICNNSNPYVAASGVTTICGKADPSALKGPVTKQDYDLGDPTPVNPDSCPTTGGTPRVAYFKPAAGGTVKFSSGMEGYGTLFIEGNAEFAGGFSYTGTVIATGDVEFGGGTVTINGGLVVKGRVKMTGNLTLRPSDCVGTTAFTDDPIVTLGALWER